MCLIRIDHHNGLMSRETTFPIPDNRTFHEVHGQGRVVGFLVQEWSSPLRAVVIHLDYPGSLRSMKLHLPIMCPV